MKGIFEKKDTIGKPSIQGTAKLGKFQCKLKKLLFTDEEIRLSH